jgi:hypothetical protein
MGGALAVNVAAAAAASASEAVPASPSAEAAAALEDVKLEDEEEAAEDWTAEAELPAALRALVDAELARVREELLRLLKLEAAKWLIGQQVLPKDSAELKRELSACIGAALTMRKEEASRKVPEFEAAGGGASLSEADRLSCESSWRLGLHAILTELRSESHTASARAAAEPWASALLEAKREVMDPNEPRLSQHMEGMWAEQVAEAKRELTGSRLRDVMKARALTVNRTLKGAMDDVERQFSDGMQQVATPKLSGSLSAEHISALVTGCIKAFRVAFDRPWAIPTLEKELESCMERDPAREAASGPQRSIKAATDIATDPEGFLLGLVLGSTQLPLADDVCDWLATVVARYLDPFIDGEVLAKDYQSRSGGLFMKRLRSAWAESHGESSELPVTPQCALAQYATHAICKMDANLGFGQHAPGIGRSPQPEYELTRYYEQLGKALVAAIQRDFEERDRAFGPLPCLGAAHIIQVSRLHVSALYRYQDNLGDALAEANRQGEEARREERLRIWGYA